jgi:hypothetical protein
VVAGRRLPHSPLHGVLRAPEPAGDAASAIPGQHVTELQGRFTAGEILRAYGMLSCAVDDDDDDDDDELQSEIQP